MDRDGIYSLRWVIGAQLQAAIVKESLFVKQDSFPIVSAGTQRPRSSRLTFGGEKNAVRFPDHLAACGYQA
jgi:hypothetical protein